MSETETFPDTNKGQQEEPFLQNTPEPNNVPYSGVIPEEEHLTVPTPLEDFFLHPLVSKPTQPPRQTEIRMVLIDRFALANGFHKNGSQQFVHSNGNALLKTDGVFPWQIQEPTGTVFRYYWIKEHCLQNKPLELPTEIWHFIENDPHHHSLILEDANGDPIEMHGPDLLNLKKDGALKLFPATYRLTLALEN